MENNQKETILLKDLGMRKHKETSSRAYRFGLFRCHCGNEFEGQTAVVLYKNVSCGCVQKKKSVETYKHSHRLYSTWSQMKTRCTNKNSKHYKNYGGRGILICNEWLEFDNFVNDMFPSFIDGYTLDRINVNGNYNKQNCRWANQTTQMQNIRPKRANNTSGYKGVSFCKERGNYETYININKKRKRLGRYKTALEAAKIYDTYVIKNNLEHTINGVL